jgi:hypothetical protein
MESSWKINLDKPVGIHNNLEHKGLIALTHTGHQDAK